MEEEGEWVTLTLVYNLLYPLANCTFNIQVESRVSFFRGRQIVSRHGSGSTVRAVPSVAFPHITCELCVLSRHPPYCIRLYTYDRDYDTIDNDIIHHTSM